MTTQIPAYIGLAMPDGKKKKKKVWPCHDIYLSILPQSTAQDRFLNQRPRYTQFHAKYSQRETTNR